MKKILKTLILAVAICVFPMVGKAFTSVASVPGPYSATTYVSYNYSSQKEADKDALEGCRVNARTNNMANLAKQCSVMGRAKYPGYGALDCGSNGCSWALSYNDMQTAVDSAYAECQKGSGDCDNKNITWWDDENGFHRKSHAEISALENCRPRTASINCRSQCLNGSCVITYENGCKMQVQVQPKFNPLNNQWEYPAPAC